MNLQNGYKVLYEKAANGARTFYASKTGKCDPTIDTEVASFVDAEYAGRTFYMHNGSLYVTCAELPGPLYDEFGLPMDLPVTVFNRVLVPFNKEYLLEETTFTDNFDIEYFGIVGPYTVPCVVEVDGAEYSAYFTGNEMAGGNLVSWSITGEGLPVVISGMGWGGSIGASDGLEHTVAIYITDAVAAAMTSEIADELVGEPAYDPEVPADPDQTEPETGEDENEE